MNAFLLSPLASPPPTSPAAAAEKLPLAPAQTGVASAVVAVHMPNPKKHLITRGGDSRAHKLNEQGAPARGNDSLPKRLASIHSIIDWLNPEGFKRYLPGGRETYCNIYAYDFGCLAGTYIPRVWWSQKAIHQLSLGASVNIKYNDTINELTANDLQRWFIDWGGHFGWSPVQSVDALQKHANTGGIALIVARSSKGHGHITMIVPENDDHKAKRNNTGTVTIPLESQAGSKNHNYVTKKSTWWTGSHFTVGFWIHA